MQIKVISFDMFQTLADVNRRIESIWKDIYGDCYTDQRAEESARSIVANIPAVMKEACEAEKFQTMAEVYERCAARTKAQLGIEKDSEVIAYHIMAQHGKAPFYEEVLDSIRRLHERYKIVISSDSNHLMVDELLKHLEYDEVFISEDLKCYKGDIKGRFFKKVIKRLQVRPEEILHIGDSTSDISGASLAGINSCLIRRTVGKGNYKVKPDHIIHDFHELEMLLG